MVICGDRGRLCVLSSGDWVLALYSDSIFPSDAAVLVSAKVGGGCIVTFGLIFVSSKEELVGGLSISFLSALGDYDSDEPTGFSVCLREAVEVR